MQQGQSSVRTHVLVTGRLRSRRRRPARCRIAWTRASRPRPTRHPPRTTNRSAGRDCSFQATAQAVTVTGIAATRQRVDCARTVRECVSRYRNFDCSGEAVLHVVPVSTVRVQESGTPVLDAAERSGVLQFLRRCGFSQRIAVHEDRAVERFGVVDGVDVPARTDLVVALRRRDAALRCALDSRRCPVVALSCKRYARALKESSQAVPLVPRTAGRNRHLRNHSQLFHPQGIGG